VQLTGQRSTEEPLRNRDVSLVPIRQPLATAAAAVPGIRLLCLTARLQARSLQSILRAATELRIGSAGPCLRTDQLVFGRRLLSSRAAASRRRQLSI